MTRQGGYLQVSFSGKQIAGWKVKETLNILVRQWSAFLFSSMPIPSFNLRYCQVLFMLTEMKKVTIESHPSHFISCNLAYLQHKLSTGWTNYSRWLITSCQLGCFSHPHFTLAHRSSGPRRSPSEGRKSFTTSERTKVDLAFVNVKKSFSFSQNIILVLKFWLSNRTEQYTYCFF